MNIKELVKEYRDVRDTLDAGRKVFKSLEATSKDTLLDLETQMLVIAEETGVDSFKTTDGTVFKSQKTYARLAAGEDAKQRRIDYAVKNNDWGLFTSHVNKTHCKELIDEGVNVSEAGIDWVVEATMNFRKPT